MRCALVIPSWVPEDIFSSKTAASQINYWQPLGTLYVAAVLRQAGQVIFVSGAFITHEQLLQDIRTFDPHFIGIYSTTFGWNKAKKTAADLRALLGDVFICTGGPYPIAVQEKCLEDAGDLFDAVITGEGENTCLEITERLAEGKSLEGVAGAFFRTGGQIIMNSPRPLMEELDALPFPARDLLGERFETPRFGDGRWAGPGPPEPQGAAGLARA